MGTITDFYKNTYITVDGTFDWVAYNASPTPNANLFITTPQTINITVNIASGTVIIFAGGTVSGTGDLVGNDTEVIIEPGRADYFVLDSTTMTYSGTWNCNIVNVAWFITTPGVSSSTDTKALNNAFSFLSEGGTIYLIPDATFIVERTTAVGDYNAAITADGPEYIIEGNNATLKLGDGEDCIVLRCGRTAAGVNRHVEVYNLNIDGNWDNQTWVGPADGGSGIYDQNGIYFFAIDYVWAENCYVYNIGMDGMPGGTCGEVNLVNCYIENTGKGGCSNFFTNVYNVTGCTFKNANSTPNPATKPYYTTSTEGYGCVGLAFLNAAEDNILNVDNCNIIVDHSFLRGCGINLSDNARELNVTNTRITMSSGTNAVRVAGQNGTCITTMTDVRILTGNPASRTINIVDSDDATLTNVSAEGTSTYLDCKTATLVRNQDIRLRITSGDNIEVYDSVFPIIDVENPMNRLLLNNVQYDTLNDNGNVTDLVIVP